MVTTKIETLLLDSTSCASLVIVKSLSVTSFEVCIQTVVNKITSMPEHGKDDGLARF